MDYSTTSYVRRMSKQSKLDRIVFHFCVIDILFLPYFPLVATNYSLPIVLTWYILFLNKRETKKDQKTFFIILFFMLSSTLIAFIRFPNWIDGVNIYRTNINKLIQYSSYFLYWSLFEHIFTNYRMNLKPYLIGFLVFAVFLALLYLYDISLFTTVKQFWNRYDALTELFMSSDGVLLYRYGFIWSDPNNPAYAFISVLFFLISIHNPKKVEVVFLLGCTMLLLVVAMSTGAFLSFLITLIVWLFLMLLENGIRGKKICKPVQITIMDIALVMILTGIIFFIGHHYKELVSSNLFLTSKNRVQNNLSNSRTAIWIRLLRDENIFKYLVFGQGATTIVNGTIRRPHNGFLYLVYSYGLIAGIFYVKFLFWKRRGTPWTKYIFALPTFIGFTVNTIIGEQKFIILHLLLMSAASSALYKKNVKKHT